MDALPRSRIIKVELEIVLPVAATRDQVEEWVKYELCQWNGIGHDNPLCDLEPEAIREPLLTDTGLHLDRQIVESSVEETGTGHSYRVRYRRVSEPIPDSQPLDPSLERLRDRLKADAALAATKEPTDV